MAEIYKEAKLFMQQMKHEFGRLSDTSSDCIIVFRSALNWPTWNSSTLTNSWIVPALDPHFKLSLGVWSSWYQQRLAELMPRTSWKQSYDTIWLLFFIIIVDSDVFNVWFNKIVTVVWNIMSWIIINSVWYYVCNTFNCNVCIVQILLWLL